MRYKDLHEDNRRAWNAATPVHNSHKADQARFLRQGGTTLFPEEIELLGDIRGLEVLHLQCNAGQDTLSLARLGASVIGVDISDEAIEFARRLSEESGIPARFDRADVYDWLEEAAQRGDQLDVVFSSYGAIGWLSDLETWARGIATMLKPGGRLTVVDFHPVAGMFDEGWKLAYPYSSGGEALSFDEGVGDYVAASGESLAPMGFVEGVRDFRNPNPVHEWDWGVGDMLGAVLAAGLAPATFKEYPYSNGCTRGEGMREVEGHRWIQPEGMPSIPFMYGLVASKEA